MAFKALHHIAALTCGAFLLSAAPALAGLDGETVAVAYHFPDLATVYPFATASQPSFTVGAGVESHIDVEGVTFIAVDFTDTGLTLTFDTMLGAPTWVSQPFNGLVFTGAGLQNIVGWTVDPASTFGVGSFTDASISRIGDDLRFNWAGVSYADGQTLNVTFAFVPEPATWAMLIAGFGLTGMAMRRRRRDSICA